MWEFSSLLWRNISVKVVNSCLVKWTSLSCRILYKVSFVTKPWPFGNVSFYLRLRKMFFHSYFSLLLSLCWLVQAESRAWDCEIGDLRVSTDYCLSTDVLRRPELLMLRVLRIMLWRRLARADATASIVLPPLCIYKLLYKSLLPSSNDPKLSFIGLT